MKKIICILLVLIVISTSLFGCNVPVDNADTDGSIAMDQSKASNDLTENTDVYNEAPGEKSISVRSREELSEIRDLLYSKDEEKLENILMQGYTIEDMSTFLDVIDSIPYVMMIDGDITWASYHESSKPNKIFYVTTEAENGDWVRITYLLQLSYAEDPVAYVTETASKENSLISQPMESSDKRVTLLSEIRDKHPTYEGDYIEWWAIIDGIAASITYYSSDIDNIQTDTLLKSLTISTIDENKIVSSEKTE